MSRGLSCEGNHEKKMIFLEKFLYANLRTRKILLIFVMYK